MRYDNRLPWLATGLLACLPPVAASADTMDRITPKQMADNAAAIAVMAYTVADLPWRLGTEK